MEKIIQKYWEVSQKINEVETVINWILEILENLRKEISGIREVINENLSKMQQGN